MIGHLLSLFVGRTVVTQRLVQAAAGTFKGVLKEKSFERADQIPEAVTLILVQEALRKAAEKEKDGQARTSEFYNQINLATDNVIAAFNGDEDVDPRIKNILVFHKVLTEPNARNARPEPTK